MVVLEILWPVMPERAKPVVSKDGHYKGATKK